jgi:tRNA/rRNA methyltransferase
LLPEAQRDRLGVILVRPRNPLNMGAAARAMANFGLEHLAVVAPYAPHWREARSAVGAPELLQNARETASLAEAVADCTLVVGTGTLTYRKAEQQVVQLPALAPLVQRELAQGGRIAVVFGPENHGLSRDDLAYCHALVEIPTDVRQPSMNLGQAVAVCLYELSSRAFSALDELPVAQAAAEGSKSSTFRPPGPAVPSGALELLSGLIEETMSAAGYSPRSMQAANRHDLRLLVRRLGLNPADTRRALGLFRRILWRLKRPSGRRDESASQRRFFLPFAPRE